MHTARRASTRYRAGAVFWAVPAFSWLRAPSRIFTNPLLPSLQAYSNNGPSTLLNGIIAVHGCVQVDGSSTVYLYSIVFSSIRVKRSVSFTVAGLEPAGAAPARKFVLSMTSVFPSQRPRGSPFQGRMLLER